MLDGAVEHGADRLGRVDGVRFDGGCFRLLTNFTAAKEIDAAIVRNLEQPGLERT